MYNKKYLISLFIILIYFLCSFPMTFSDYNEKTQITNVQAMAIYTVIFDLYKTKNRNNMDMDNFKNQFIKDYGDIIIENSDKGIWIYLHNGVPESTGGDALYLIDKNNFTIIKRELGK